MTTLKQQREIDVALAHIDRMREATTANYERAMRKLDNDERDLLGLRRDDGVFGGQMNILSKIEPQPPRGIKYMLGDETWMPQEQRSPIRMVCEEWGNLGPMELDPSIKPNKAGFRVRTTELLAPPGALGFTQVDGVYYWTDCDHYGRSADERSKDT